MTIGHSAICRLVAKDNTTVIYEYACSDWNQGNYDIETKTFDGVIMIDKDCFVKAELRTKIKRNPNGRKIKITKKIMKHVDVLEYLSNNKIKVDNCNACRNFLKIKNTEKSVGLFAIKLLIALFDDYQKNDTIPETLGFVY